jgi:hypothetical protein
MVCLKKCFLPAMLAMVVFTFSRCAKESSESVQNDELQLIKSTVRVYFPSAQPIENDSSMWLIARHPNTSGHSATPQEESYVEFGYHGKLLPALRSVVYQTTDSLDARRLGTFAATTHYAPIFSYYHKDYMQKA